MMQMLTNYDQIHKKELQLVNKHDANVNVH